MSLEELRALAAQGDEEETEQPEEEAELEEVEEPDPEEADDDEGEESETDFLEELELEGEPEPSQQKPKPEEAILHKLTKQRKKRQEAESENEQLKAKLAELEARMNGQSSQQYQTRQPAQPQLELPRFPDMYDPGIDGDRQKYDQAIKSWYMQAEDAKQRYSQRTQAQSEYEKQIEQKTHRLAERVGKFASQHKMKDDYVIGAVERATDEIDKATGMKGSFAHLLDAVGDGSEKAAIYVGSKPHELENIKNMLAEDRSGLKAIAYLTRIATRKPAQRKTSNAPEPDQPLRGDGGSAKASKLQKMYDKEKDAQKLIALRQQARKLGITLK